MSDNLESANFAKAVKEHAWGVILAAGAGKRMAGACSCPKQFLIWAGEPLFWHSAKAFSRCACIDGLLFVFPPDFCEEAETLLRKLDYNHFLGLPWQIVPGGQSRSESSRNAVYALPANVKKALIHDAARPFLQPSLVWRVWEALDDNYAGVAPGLQPGDTIKQMRPDGTLITLPRSELRAVQTPQGFDVEALKNAWRNLPPDALLTDDAMILEKAGYKIKLVQGSPENIKITAPEDLRWLKEREKMIPCSGFGYDAHRYGQGRPLKIGGVPIPAKFEVEAHSDGDVLLHALCDALLGCAALGDIGEHFPDSDPEIAGISSALMLDQVLEKITLAGVSICHVDLTVVAQKPRFAPWREEIRKNVARLLSLPPERVNFKATTEERLGFTGRCEGIKAYALANGFLKG